MTRLRRLSVAAITGALLVSWGAPRPAGAQAGSGNGQARVPVYKLTLPNGKHASVYADGTVLIFANPADVTPSGVRMIRTSPSAVAASQAGMGLPDKFRLAAMLAKEPNFHPYAAGSLIIVYRPGTQALHDVTDVDLPTLMGLRRAAARHQAAATTPSYTNDLQVNRALAQLGVDRSSRLFARFNRSELSALHTGVEGPNREPTLDFSAAYKLHLTGASVQHAVEALAKLPQVAYVSPDWFVDTTRTDPIRVNTAAQQAALQRARAMRARSEAESVSSTRTYVPSNYGIASSLQSMFNAPSDDDAAAYDEIERHFHQLPGEGEIITNVSEGDLDDARAAKNTSDPCFNYAFGYGPTTEIINGKRYINLPSLPLIPTYTADDSGNLNGSGEVCGNDPYDTEIDLDFTQMAPLPHELQRPGETGNGITDLLGIAPGAQYRLIVPGDAEVTLSDIQAAFLAAAMQTPRPNVITASLAFGEDGYGFPSRFLEDDALTEAIVASIVQNEHVAVVIAANDGTRSGATDAAIGPSGGSAPTNLAAPGGTSTTVDDVALSTTPSLDFDSGAIDAGGTTLDDIFSNPPQYATSEEVKAQHAYAETRWTGFTSFSSGYGSRVDLSAPSDNIIGFEHTPGEAADAVSVAIDGGTSASAPEIAATVAVVQQVARLTGHAFEDPKAVRAFLQQTGTPVPAVAQADTRLNVGPQVDVRRAVEMLLERGGVHDAPSVPRVAIEQRRNYGDIDYDGTFVSDTDPANINLDSNSWDPSIAGGYNAYQWITIAPDWEFVAKNATYRLRIAGTGRVLATTPWARLLPEIILNAAGDKLASSSYRTVKFMYTATSAGKSVSTTFSLTFGPVGDISYEVLAPKVPPVITGSTIPVTYDLSRIPIGDIGKGEFPNPTLMISEPGRIDGWTGYAYHPVYEVPITSTKGTIDVPVSKLQGGGIYSVGIQPNAEPPVGSLFGCYCDYAFTRVAPQRSDDRPAAPLLSANGSIPGHILEIPYGGTFQLSYDVSNVPGVTGAELEISAAGPTLGNSAIYNPFNNPNGSERDDNGVDTGSIYFAPLGGTAGTVTLNGIALDLYPTMNHVIRVIPMKGAVAAGEAGNVSTIVMDGVAPSDGGLVWRGYGIDGNGTDGFLTSNQETASGQPLSSIELFDQANNQITQDSISESTSSYSFTAPFTGTGPGIFGNDVGLVGAYSYSPLGVSYSLIDPVSAGNLGAAWTPPAPLDNPFILSIPAPNQANDNVVFEAQVGSNFDVYSSQITENTFSPLYNIASLLQNFDTPHIWGFAEDTTTNTAVIAADNSGLGICDAPLIVSVNLSNGSTTSFSGVQEGASSMAIDSSTGNAVIPTQLSCQTGGIGIYNLARRSGFQVVPPEPGSPTPGDTFYLQSAADPVHHLFLVADLFGPVANGNNNALSQIFVYTETGRLEKVISRIWIPATSPIGNALQVNPKTRTGYIIGPGYYQLAVFHY